MKPIDKKSLSIFGGSSGQRKEGKGKLVSNFALKTMICILVCETRTKLNEWGEITKLSYASLAPPLISTSNRLCEDWINRRIPTNSSAAKLIKWNHVTGLCCCWRQAVRRLIESLQKTLRHLRFHLRKLFARAGPKMYKIRFNQFRRFSAILFIYPFKCIDYLSSKWYMLLVSDYEDLWATSCRGLRRRAPVIDSELSKAFESARRRKQLNDHSSSTAKTLHLPRVHN